MLDIALQENADAIRHIESKVYNTHDPLENLRLAFSPEVRLTVPSRER